MKPRSRPFDVFLLFPLLFLFLHQLVLNLMASLRLQHYLKVVDPSGLLFDISDPAVLQELSAVADVQTYGSLYAALLLIPVYALYLGWRQRRDPAVVSLKSSPAASFFSALSIMVGSLGVVTLWMALLYALAPRFSGLESLLAEYGDLAARFVPSGSPLLSFLSLVVLVPIAEELLFRGIVQGEFQLALGRKWAIGLTLLLFSLFHLNPIQISYVLLPAFCLSLVYAATENLFLPIAMHMLFNFLGSGLLASWTQDPERTQALVVSLELLFIVIGGLSLIRLLRQPERKADHEDPHPG